MKMDLKKIAGEKRKQEIEKRVAIKESRDRTICCSTTMRNDGVNYFCDICNSTYDYETDRQGMETAKRAYIKISSGSHGKYYNTQQDAEITQQENIYKHLLDMQNQYEGYQISKDILATVMKNYAQIQCLEVKRGNHKDEILAALIFFECINQNAERKRKDIAVFMQLKTGGFARGEATLRNFVANGEVNVKLGEESVSGYADKYMEILELGKCVGISKYAPMISEIINRADEKRLDVSSLTSSKVAGTIWFIVVKVKYDMRLKELEKKCDNIKSNTIKKFYDIIINNREVFTDIFTKYSIV